MKKFTFHRFLLAGVAAVAILPAVAMAGDLAVASDANAVSAQAPVQVAEAEQLADAGGGLSIGEVVVTARRQAENLRDVPISVQAISGETLDLTGTFDLQNLINQTPGLNSTGGNPRNFSVLIRGIGYAPTAADGLDNAIGVYFDGVYQARPGQILQDLVDVSSFEILRGPQGTLFGRNAAAGAINVTSNKPSFTPSQSVEVSAGNYSFFQGKAVVTGPLSDTVAYRASIYGTSADGFLDAPFKRSFRDAAASKGIYAPTAGDQTTTASTGRYGGRLQFLINASDKLSITVAGDLAREADTSSGFSSGGGITELYGPGNWGINTTAAQQTRVTNVLTALGNLENFGGVQKWVPRVDPNSSITNNSNFMSTTQGGVAITANYDLDWANLTSISAWRFWKFYPPQDSDGSPIDIYDNEAISRSNQFSEELRLASKDKGPIEWQGGVFLYYSKLKDHYQIHQFGADVIPWYNAYNTTAGTAGFTPIPISFRPQMTGVQIIEDTHVQNQNAAVYGQATWHILDDLDLTGGARYTYDRKSGGSPVDTSQLSTTLPTGITNAQLNAFYNAIGAVFRNPGVTYNVPGYPAGVATTGYPLGAATSANNVSGSASLSYKITPDATAYFAFSNGFQAGGLDLNNGSANASAVSLAPTITYNYEVGFKAALFDHRLAFNFAVYQETLDGFQTSISYTLPNGTAYRGATNAGNIRARGVEWDATAAVTEEIRVTFAGNYNDSIYTYAPSLPAPAELSYNGVANIDAKGQTAPFSPKLTFAITPSFTHPIGADKELYGYAQYSYTSSLNTGVTRSIYTQVPAQDNLNLRLGVRLDEGKYDVSLYANNALDAKNIASQGLLSAPSGAGVTAYLGRTVSYNPPAKYGVTLKAKF